MHVFGGKWGFLVSSNVGGRSEGSGVVGSVVRRRERNRTVTEWGIAGEKLPDIKRRRPWIQRPL